MSEERFRNRVYWLTFFFSLLVVWVHSSNWELFLGQSPEGLRLGRLEAFCGEGLGQMAVPGFFMVSAYLFFRGFTWKKLPYKWKSRLFTVAVPYGAWNFIYYCAYAAASCLPLSEGIMDKGVIPLSLAEGLRAVFFYQYNPVFWYLFQLILLIAAAPAVYAVFKRNGTALMAAALLGWAIFAGWRLGPLNTDALAYYCAGAWAAIHREERGRFAESGRLRAWAVPCAVFGVLLGAVWLLGRPGGPLYNSPLAAVLVRLAMACLSWLAVSLLPLGAAPAWAKNSFFLYAIHFAWVRLFNKAGALLFPGSLAAALGIFLALPPVMAALSYGLGRLMERAVPGIYRVLCGGRGGA